MKLLGRRVLFGTPRETDEEIQCQLEKLAQEDNEAAKEEREARREDREEKPSKRRKNKPTKGAKMIFKM